MSDMSPPPTAMMTVAMMVAMMLPSFAPTLWRRHRHLRAMRVPRAARQTTLFAAGYLGVWTAMGVALAALPAFALSPWATAGVVLCAGALQCSRWKAKQLHRCRDACTSVQAESRNVMISWLRGCRLGVDCCLSCAAPMAVLYVAGLMDVGMMMLITAAITAERVAPGGARIARLTGGVALMAGLLMCV